ncbi:MAG: hypothetical protein AAF411_19670 [Myxococcota bacterium]
MADSSLRMVLQEGRNCVATCENLVLAIWGETPRPAPMTAIHLAHLELLEEHDHVGHLVLIHGLPRLPTPEARALAGRYSEQSRMSSIAVIMEGDGFWLSAARGFLTAVLFVQRSSAPTQLFKGIDPALEWQGRVLDRHAPDQSSVTTALEALRRRSEQPPSM